MMQRETILTVSKEQQYTYGVEVGRILQSFTPLATEVREDWRSFYNRKKIDDKNLQIQRIVPSSIRNGRFLLIFKSKLLKDRPQVFLHGDIISGIFMIGEDGEIYVIDFDRFDLEILGRNSPY